MRKLLFIILCLVHMGIQLTAQDKLSLKWCHELIISTNPRTLDKDILTAINKLKLEQIDADAKPGINWISMASLQSDNVSLPFSAPGSPQVDLPLYRFQSYIDASYLIYDGGLEESLHHLEAAKLELDLKSLEAELENLRILVNKYYFGILRIQEYNKILVNTRADLDNKIQTLKDAMEYGVVLEMEVDKLLLERAKISAGILENSGDIEKLKSVLAYLIELPISDSTELEIPDISDFQLNPENNRKEVELLDLRQSVNLLQNEVIDARDKPKVSAFAQAGIGYPNPLNFFEEELTPYAMGGIQMNWKLADWGSNDREKELIQLNNALLENRKQSFLKQLNQVDQETRAELEKIDALITLQKDIVEKQSAVTGTISEQLNYGVVTSNDYLTELNAGINAKTQLESLHLRKLEVQLNYLTTKGLY